MPDADGVDRQSEAEQAASAEDDCVHRRASELAAGASRPIITPCVALADERSTLDDGLAGADHRHHSTPGGTQFLIAAVVAVSTGISLIVTIKEADPGSADTTSVHGRSDDEASRPVSPPCRMFAPSRARVDRLWPGRAMRSRRRASLSATPAKPRFANSSAASASPRVCR